ncbi:MAG: hypothetical protein QOE30_3817 [Mycobacterium sp.]|nr:hypothetical protein [Mycobacterium sp.]
MHSLSYESVAVRQMCSGAVSVNKDTFDQHVSADSTYRLRWPNVDITVDCTMLVDVSADSYAVDIKGTATQDGIQVFERVWTATYPRRGQPRTKCRSASRPGPATGGAAWHGDVRALRRRGRLRRRCRSRCGAGLVAANRASVGAVFGRRLLWTLRPRGILRRRGPGGRCGVSRWRCRSRVRSGCGCGRL